MGQLHSCQQTKPGNETPQQFLSPTSLHMQDPQATRIAQLCFAAAEGKLAYVQKLVERRAEVNSVDYDRRSALHIAAANGRLEVVQHLISARADVQAVDRWGHTPMDDAMNGPFADVQAALRTAGAEHGVTPRESESTKVSPDGTKLCSIAAEGDLDALKKLQATGVDLNAQDYECRTALIVAAAHGHVELVQWLAEARADVNLRDNFGLTALTEATRKGHNSVIKVLTSKGAEKADLQALRLSSDTEHWAIPSHEVELGKILSRTLKSSIYIANWRGTKVVAKTSGRLGKSISGASLADWPSTNTSEDSDDDSALALAKSEVLHEIRLLSTLRHPDLVMFLGACLDHDPPFFITEFMEGGDLERYFMSKSKQLGHDYRPPGDIFMRWAKAIARALAFLHNCSRPVIHRDLKPLNLLLNSTNDLKVTDFGISKLMNPKARCCSSIDKSGEPPMSGGVGTWRYMAPEVVRYEQYTDRVDIYSFALILWFMSTGQQPFAEQFGRDAEVVLKEYLKGKEPRPDVTYAGARCGPPIPTQLRELMKDCWHETPALRPSAYECTQRLGRMCPSDCSSTGNSFLGGFFRQVTK
mmetsp:Transcript_55795/g.154452  ORF Transcript_55795/g.154452 Transcript_55795/m.154452 type:complete len:586 (-) Transcript_55795:356-2113(-)